jgi:seryl-tRNA synthetase
MTEIVTEIEQIKNEKQLMKKELGDLLTQLQTLQEKIKQIMDPHVAKIQEHEDNIRNLILMLEKSYKGEDGSKATFRKEHVRTSWDTKALEGYAAAGNDAILQFKKETVVPASVSISIAEVE